MSAAARLALAGLVRAPGRTADRGSSCWRPRPRCSAAMLLFVGNSLQHDDGQRRAQRAAGLAGPGRSLAASAAGRRRRRAPAGRPAGLGRRPPRRWPSGAPPARRARPARAAASVLAVPPDYLSHIQTFRMLQGALRPGAVVLDQQMAATLQARIGDRVASPPPREPGRTAHGHRRGAGHRARRALPAAQPAARPGAGPAARQRRDPAARHLRPHARAVAPHDHARRTPARTSSPAPRRASSGRCRRSSTRGRSRAAALGRAKRADRTRNRVERSLPGQVQFVDNLSDSLNTAAGDALYAQALYIMLAVPGALIALGLAYLAALGTAERDRRDLALLRARGATRRDLSPWPASRAP